MQELLAKKRAAHQAHLAQPSCPEKKASFCQACSNLQHRLWEIQNDWKEHLAQKTQLCAHYGD